MRRALPLAVLLLAGCSDRPEAAAPAATATPPVASPAPAADAPLPKVDEVPAFLLEDAPAVPEADARQQAAADPWVPADLPVEVILDDRQAADFALAEKPANEPTLAELMQQVTVEDGAGVAEADDDAWAFIGGGSDEEPPEMGTEQEPAIAAIQVTEVETAEMAIEIVDEDPAAGARPVEDDDPCASLRLQVERRQDYLRRTAAERDAFGYVESDEDAQALRLLQGLRRCADHPDDADCQPPPMERDISELEQPAHRIHRHPNELNAEGKKPDEIPHDPLVLDLLHQLERCERRTVAQPLLQPKPQR